MQWFCFGLVLQGERRSSVILNFDGWSNTEKWTGSDLWSGYFPVSVTAGTWVLQKTLPVWESGKFRLWRSVLFWANFSVCSHRVDNLQQVSCWCFVDGDIMPLLYCFQSWHTFLKQCGGRLHRLQITDYRLRETWHLQYVDILQITELKGHVCFLIVMFFPPSCQMEGSGSPRFRKLHFPVGLWINSPRKHFAKLGGRWPSAISVKSVSQTHL